MTDGVRGRLEAIARRRPAGTFFVTSFAFSWGFLGLLYALLGSDIPDIVAAPFAWGPLVGGALTVRLLGDSVRDWFGQIRDWRVGVHWYLLGIAIVLVRTDVAAVLALLGGADVTVRADAWQLYAMLFNFLLTLLFAGALEEFGWRGFAQVRLQERYDATLVAALIGVLWAAWHAPLMAIGLGGFTDPVNYVLLQVGASIVYAWLYNATDGALLVVMVAHAASNMPGVLEVTGETPAVLDGLPVSPNVVFVLAVAAVVVRYAGSKTLARTEGVPDVPGRRKNGVATAD